MAKSAPTTSPKPQLIQLAVSETRVTSRIAPPGVVASAAMRVRMRFTKGVLASMKPATSTSSICMENSSSFQKPSPHMVTTASGFWRSISTAARKTTRVRISTKI